MKHLLLGMLCLLVVCNRLAATPATTDLTPVDRLAQNVPSYASKSIESLAFFGKTNTNSDREAVRFYFVWLAQNIHYDSLELASTKRRTSKQDPDSVFLNRKGICRGYADLMTLLCEKAGIPARTVTGYSKSMEGQADSVDFHAWNIIKTDKKWHLFDVTWASNHFENDETLDAFFNNHFEQTASTFIKRHFPFDPVFQLSEKALVRGAFFFENTEGPCDMKDIGNFTKILDEEALLSPLEQNIKSYERAILFIPEERRLYDVLSYFQSEKAHILFNEGSDILDKFRKLEPESVVNWSYKTVKKNVEEATEAHNFFKKALKLYETMLFIEENDDAKLKQKNLLIIQKNVDATGKLIDYLKGLESELKKIGIAQR
jgi:hypothetical protein